MALDSVARFLIDVHVGPRTLETATQLVASVALCCRSLTDRLLILVDNHLPYPQAILSVFGRLMHRRRKRGHGRHKYPGLKPPPNLLVGVVEKVRSKTGKVLKVKARRLFGSMKRIRWWIRRLHLGREVNTAHVERLNGTMRGHQARLARRTRDGSRLEAALQWSLSVWRDLYNWVWPHGSLSEEEPTTPAMAMGLAGEVWSARGYVEYPVHVSDLQRQDWADRRNDVLESALDKYQRQKVLPTS